MQRRFFLKTTGLGSLGIALGRCSVSRAGTIVESNYDLLNSDKYLGPVKVETRIQDAKIFTEGPAVDRLGHVYFTNIPVSKILKWDPINKELTVFRTDSNQANGLRFAPDGDLLICEGGTGRVTKMNLETGEKSVLADQFNGKNLQSPNDLDYDNRGRIYFSSRTDSPDLTKENQRSLYRLDPDGKVHQLLTEPAIHMPNGVVVSPDHKSLYLIEAHGGIDRNRNILAFDLLENGSLDNRRTLFDFYPGRSGDGMCIDAKGNLYVAAGLHKTRGSSETLDTRPGIHVISPKGKLLAFRETPEDTITNCTFGGADLKTLYITAGSYLLSIRTMIPGKSSLT